MAIIAATYLAGFLGLEYGASAGIFAVLSIMETKRKTIETAVNRFFSALLGLILASVLFMIFGFEVYVIGLLVILFLPIALRFDLQGGFITNLVFAHQLIDFGEVTVPIFLNQISLVTIGIGTGVLLNLHIPHGEEQIIQKQKEIDGDLRVLLEIFGYGLKNASPLDHNMEADMEKLSEHIREGLQLAYRYIDNRYLQRDHYYVQYMLMRKNQMKILEAMKRSLGNKVMSREFAESVSRVTLDLAGKIDTNSDGVASMEKLQEIKAYYRKLPLPESRREFEDRAHLFVFFHHLENFIQIKTDFYRGFMNNEKKTGDNKRRK